MNFSSMLATAMLMTMACGVSSAESTRDGTTQKAFTIYAWNEFGEGGIVAPTKGSATMILEAIREVFGENP